MEKNDEVWADGTALRPTIIIDILTREMRGAMQAAVNGAQAKDFMDRSLIEEIQRSGYIDRLYRR